LDSPLDTARRYVGRALTMLSVRSSRRRDTVT
jgi:hypothetical protein